MDNQQHALTIAELKAEDYYTDAVLTEATRSEDGSWTLTWSMWSVGLAAEHAQGLGEIVPAPGMAIRVYGAIGRPVHGLDIDGREVFWRTPRERAADHAATVARIDREWRQRFEEARPDLDARVAALPEPFRQRIERRRENNPEFRQHYESYELFCCEQAVALAERARETDPADPAGWIVAWARMGKVEGGYDHDGQRRLFPAMDKGHSGNTYATMLSLAHAWLADPDLVDRQYGALAPLVGSDAYGDVDS